MKVNEESSKLLNKLRDKENYDQLIEKLELVDEEITPEIILDVMIEIAPKDKLKKFENYL